MLFQEYVKYDESYKSPAIFKATATVLTNISRLNLLYDIIRTSPDMGNIERRKQKS